MPDIRFNHEVYDYGSYDLTKVPLSGQVRYFTGVKTGQIEKVYVVGDNSKRINQLPFENKLIIMTSGNVDLEDLRITGNRVQVVNTGSMIIAVEIGTAADSKLFYLQGNKKADFIFNSSVWIHEDVNIITMGDSDLTLKDVSGSTHVILPSTGITANRTVTLPTLADNQNMEIKFENMNTSYQMIIDGEGSETIETLFDKINLSTEYSILRGDSLTWKRIGYSPIRPIFQVEYRLSSGSNSGNCLSGAWRTRPMNIEVINNIIDASLNITTYRISLPYGKYNFFAALPMYNANRTKIKLQYITGGTGDFINSTNNYSSGMDGTVIINDEMTFLVNIVYEIQQRNQVSESSHGYGVECGSSFTVNHEKYGLLRMVKLI